MAEIRRDPIIGRWVIIATDRAARPRDFFAERAKRRSGFCPFCEGNEDRTPPEITAVRPAGSSTDSPGWKVRVVPNKFPALQAGVECSLRGAGIHQSMSGFGAHEVIIESPRHVVSPTEMAAEELRLVIQTWCERARELSEDHRLAYVLVFKNVGRSAGASIEHAHSQLIAVPVMPKRVHEEIESCREHYERSGRCLFCDMMEQERDEEVRVVMENEHFMVLSPFAARFPFEAWLLPHRHTSHFFEMDEQERADLAEVLREALARLETCLSEPPYNLAIHMAPVTGEGTEYYHWHMELMPRVTRVAGFEWGTGFYINPMAPEKAARFLREVPGEELQKRLSSSYEPSQPRR